jgi:hypothetical protein
MGRSLPSPIRLSSPNFLLWPGKLRAGKDQRPRSRRPCCREHHGDRPTVTHTGDDGLSEADRIDSLDLGRSILQCANFWHRVRQPDPGLVEQGNATERGELLKRTLELGEGPGQLDVSDERPDDDQLDRPVGLYANKMGRVNWGAPSDYLVVCPAIN